MSQLGLKKLPIPQLTILFILMKINIGNVNILKIGRNVQKFFESNNIFILDNLYTTKFLIFEEAKKIFFDHTSLISLKKFRKYSLKRSIIV
jgi:hypothetical protein